MFNLSCTNMAISIRLKKNTATILPEYCNVYKCIKYFVLPHVTELSTTLLSNSWCIKQIFCKKNNSFSDIYLSENLSEIC